MQKSFSGKATWKVTRSGGIKDEECSQSVNATVELKDGELRYVVRVGKEQTTAPFKTRHTSLPRDNQLKSAIRNLAETIIKQNFRHGGNIHNLSIKL